MFDPWHAKCISLPLFRDCQWQHVHVKDQEVAPSRQDIWYSRHTRMLASCYSCHLYLQPSPIWSRQGKTMNGPLNFLNWQDVYVHRPANDYISFILFIYHIQWLLFDQATKRHHVLCSSPAENHHHHHHHHQGLQSPLRAFRFAPPLASLYSQSLYTNHVAYTHSRACASETIVREPCLSRDCTYRATRNTCHRRPNNRSFYSIIATLNSKQSFEWHFVSWSRSACSVITIAIACVCS